MSNNGFCTIDGVVRPFGLNDGKNAGSAGMFSQRKTTNPEFIVMNNENNKVSNKSAFGRCECFWCPQTVFYVKPASGGCFLADDIPPPTWHIHKCWKEYGSLPGVVSRLTKHYSNINLRQFSREPKFPPFLSITKKNKNLKKHNKVNKTKPVSSNKVDIYKALEEFGFSMKCIPVELTGTISLISKTIFIINKEREFVAMEINTIDSSVTMLIDRSILTQEVALGTSVTVKVDYSRFQNIQIPYVSEIIFKFKIKLPIIDTIVSIKGRN